MPALVLQIDVLVFQGTPQALDEDIVHPASASVHRNLDSSFEQHAGEVPAGELAALIGGSGKERRDDGLGFAQCRDRQRHVQKAHRDYRKGNPLRTVARRNPRRDHRIVEARRDATGRHHRTDGASTH